MKMNKYHLRVLDALKNQDSFFKPNTILFYNEPQDGAQIDLESHGAIIPAVYDLESFGAFTIYNKHEERIPGTVHYEFQLTMNHDAFEGIYQKCIRIVEDMSLHEYEELLSLEKNLPAIKKKLQNAIRSAMITGKQLKMLTLLSDFQHHRIDKLRQHVPSDDVKDLKKHLQKKISPAGFIIKTIRNKSSFVSGEYQLLYLPPTQH